MAAALAQALLPAGEPACGVHVAPEAGDPMTTIAAAVAHIDKMTADLSQSDEAIVALVIENAKLRAQVAELKAIMLLRELR